MSDVIFKQSEGCFTKLKNGVLCVVLIGDDGYFEIDGEFIKLWDLIDGSLTQKDLISKFANMIGEEPEEIQEEVESFFTELQNHNLICKSGPISD